MTIKINICNFTKNDSLYDKVFFLNIIILRVWFEYTFHYDDDEVSFAYAIPYTYS